jgi:hypothetical protein
MKTVLFSHAGNGTGPSNSANRFAPLVAGILSTTWQSTHALGSCTIPIDGTFSNLYARFPTAIGAGTSYTLTVHKNGTTDMNVTCQITDAALTASDTVNTAAFSQGDTFSYKCVPAGTPTANGIVQLGILFEATTPGESMVFGSASGVSNSVASYIPLGGTTFSATENLASVVFPTDGVLDRLYVITSGTPGGAATYTFEVMKEGIVEAGLSAQVASGATTANDTTGSVSVAAGETISIRCTPASTPTSRNATLSMRWVPTVSGESVLFSNTIVDPSNSATRYFNLNGFNNSGNATEANAYNVVPYACTIRDLRVEVNTAPGAGNTRAITLSKVGVDQAITTTLGDAETTETDLSNEYSASAGELLTWKTVPASTPDAPGGLKIGVVAFIDPGAGAGGNPHKGSLLLGVG